MFPIKPPFDVPIFHMFDVHICYKPPIFRRPIPLIYGLMFLEPRVKLQQSAAQRHWGKMTAKASILFTTTCAFGATAKVQGKQVNTAGEWNLHSIYGE